MIESYVPVTSDTLVHSAAQKLPKRHDTVYAHGQAVYAVFDGAATADGSIAAKYRLERMLKQESTDQAPLATPFELIKDMHYHLRQSFLPARQERFKQAVRERLGSSTRERKVPLTTAALGRFVRMVAQPDSLGFPWAAAGDSMIYVGRAGQNILEPINEPLTDTRFGRHTDTSPFLGAKRPRIQHGFVELTSKDCRVVLVSDGVNDPQKGLSLKQLSEIVLTTPIEEAAQNVIDAIEKPYDDASVIVVGSR